MSIVVGSVGNRTCSTIQILVGKDVTISASDPSVEAPGRKIFHPRGLATRRCLLVAAVWRSLACLIGRRISQPCLDATTLDATAQFPTFPFGHFVFLV
jgi:hypothetical protein